MGKWRVARNWKAEIRKWKLETRKQEVKSRKSKTGWRPEGRRYVSRTKVRPLQKRRAGLKSGSPAPRNLVQPKRNFSGYKTTRAEASCTCSALAKTHSAE